MCRTTEAGKEAVGNGKEHRAYGCRVAPTQEVDTSSLPGALVTAAQVGLMVVACKNSTDFGLGALPSILQLCALELKPG